MRRNDLPRSVAKEKAFTRAAYLVRANPRSKAVYAVGCFAALLREQHFTIPNKSEMQARAEEPRLSAAMISSRTRWSQIALGRSVISSN